MFLLPLFSHHPTFREVYLCGMSCHFPHCSCAQLLCPRCPWHTDVPTGHESWEKKWTQLKDCAVEKYWALPYCSPFCFLFFWAALQFNLTLIYFNSRWITQYCMRIPRTQSYLQRISVTGRISPSQFHTDTAGDLLQHRPHRKEFAVFCSFVISRPVPLSVRCCWDPFLLTVSTKPPTSSSNPWLVPPISSFPSSSLPGGREKRTAFTRWTSTNGRSN